MPHASMCFLRSHIVFLPSIYILRFSTVPLLVFRKHPLTRKCQYKSRLSRLCPSNSTKQSLINHSLWSQIVFLIMHLMKHKMILWLLINARMFITYLRQKKTILLKYLNLTKHRSENNFENQFGWLT